MHAPFIGQEKICAEAGPVRQQFARSGSVLSSIPLARQLAPSGQDMQELFVDVEFPRR